MTPTTTTCGRCVDVGAFGPTGPFSSPVLEQLEPRVLLNGVTIITHGHNSDSSGWVNGMADAVADRIAGDSAEYTLLLGEGSDDKPDSYSLIPDDPARTYDLVDSGQAIIKLDWSEMTDGLFDFGTSTTDVGRYVADWLTAGDFAQMPIHLIGHSRGASVNTAIAQRLAASGIWVDHVTTLDPHPLDDDSPIATYDNVRFADNYWRTGGIFDPDGEFVPGAHDRELNEDILAGWFDDPGYGGGHSDVHLWYHGTIDSDGPVDDGEVTLTVSQADEWYDASNDMPSPRDHVGFYYSLISGGDRTELGGWLPTAASRTHVARWGTQWSNLGATLVPGGPSAVSQGDDIPITYRYQSANPCDISFGFDTDRNPYNSSSPQYLDTIAMPATSDATAFDDGSAETIDLDTFGVLPGVYYLVASIAGAGTVRYAYSDVQVTIKYVLPGDADRSGSVNGDDYAILVGSFGLSGSDLPADFDRDGRVGLSDFVTMRENFGRSLPGLVTSVNQSPENAEDSPVQALAPAVTETPPPEAAETLMSPLPEQKLPAANAQPTAIEKDQAPDMSPLPDRDLSGVLTGGGSVVSLDADDLLADVLLEAEARQFETL